MLLSQAIYGFTIARTAEGYSSNTLDMYKWALRLLGNYLDDPDPAEVTYKELQSFFAYLATDYIPSRSNGDKSPLSRRSVENIWTAIRSFYNWAEDELGILSNDRPDIGLKRPRYAPSEIDPYTEDELKALIKACEYTSPAATEKRKSFAMKRPTAERDIALLLLLLDTGIRASECARLQIKDVTLDTGEIRIHEYGSGQKTRSRSVYLGKAARHALWKYLSNRSDTETSLFITERSGLSMNRSSIRHIIARAGKRAKVTGSTTHRFRHTFAVQYLRNGGDVFTLQRLLGHSTLDMVRRYVALASTDDATVHRRASPVDNWRL